MGRLIIKIRNGHLTRLESFKCKSKEKAAQIVRKRPNSIEWNYYENNERIPMQKKKIKQHMPTSFEELEIMMKKQGLI